MEKTKVTHYSNSQWSFDDDGMTSRPGIYATGFFESIEYHVDRQTIINDGDVIEHLCGKKWVHPLLAIDCYLRALQYYKTGRLPSTYTLSSDGSPAVKII